MNWENDKKVRKSPLDFCWVMDPDSHFKSLPLQAFLDREKMKQEFCGLSKIDNFRYCYNLFYDHVADIKSEAARGGLRAYQGFNFKGIVQSVENSNDISLSEIPTYATRTSILYFHKDGYEQHCKEYKSYKEWLDKRNTQRYVDVEGHGQKIDGKNLLHCRRLLDTSFEIAKGLGLRVRRPNAKYLIEIRKGKYNLTQIMKDCEDLLTKSDKMYEESKLPDSVDRGEMMKILVKMRKAFYKPEVRFTTADTGPG
jgi:hypothetical protein